MDELILGFQVVISILMFFLWRKDMSIKTELIDAIVAGQTAISGKLSTLSQEIDRVKALVTGLQQAAFTAADADEVKAKIAADPNVVKVGDLETDVKGIV